MPKNTKIIKKICHNHRKVFRQNLPSKNVYGKLKLRQMTENFEVQILLVTIERLKTNTLHRRYQS